MWDNTGKKHDVNTRQTADKPQTTINGSSSVADDFCNENTWITLNMWIVSSACNAESKACVSLKTQTNIYKFIYLLTLEIN